MVNRGGWIVEVDIRKFFDTLDHRHLREFIGRRVRDGVLLRLIGKWLSAGVMEDGCVSYPDSGSPLGIAQWCGFNRHRPLAEQQRTLSQKLRGHYAYYGITGNSTSLSRFFTAVVSCWRKWLSRRNRQRSTTWDVFHRLLRRYPLPGVRVVHSVFSRANE